MTHRITAVRRRGRRVIVSFDQAAPLDCDRDFPGVREAVVGDALDLPLIERLRHQAVQHDAHSVALRLLGQRARSELEMLSRLRKRGIANAIAKETVAGLRDCGLIDDGAFARQWTEERVRLRPRSARLIEAELRAKGVSPSTASEATAAVRDDDLALRVAEEQARRCPGDWPAFQRRAGGALLRRGFSQAVAERALRRAWEACQP